MIIKRIILRISKEISERKKHKIPTNGWYEISLDGLKWKLKLDRYIDRTIALEKEFEPTTSELVKQIVKPGMRVLDIGANIGYYTNIIAKKIETKGKIFAFEPVSEYRMQLEWHVKENRFNDIVKVLPYGLSNMANKMNIGRDNVSASLHWAPLTPPTNTEEIELKKLDDIYSSEDFNNIDFIKIDIDGHEIMFLDGAIDFFKKNQPIILLEFANLSLHVAGTNVIILKEKLEKMGYIIYSEKTKKPFIDIKEFLIECGNYSFSANAWAIPTNLSIKINSLSDL
jgi:FkbM family methyltransferase